MVEKIFSKFSIKFEENLQKIYGISKLITLELENRDQVVVDITEINIFKNFKEKLDKILQKI